MTNGMWVAMSREVALMTLVYYNWAIAKGIIAFPEMRSGWGLDIVYASIAILADRKVYRDSDITFYHPPGSSYDGAAAGREMNKVTHGFYDFAPSLGFTKQQAIDLHTLILTKVQQRDHYKPTVADVYVNSDPNMEF
jgi:hypothetical protein